MKAEVRLVQRGGWRCLLLLSTFCLLPSCGREAETPVVPPAREPIAIAYVGAPELEVHAKADDASPVVTKFLNGESVSILSRNDKWIEVRTTDGSGWAHAADVTTAAAAKEAEANPSPKFRVQPSPVTQPGIHGTVYIEASVNTEGDVTSTTIITNTTGSPALAERNAAALRLAKFYPIVVKGQKKDFLYDYRVDY
jgi:outer membrane biosynthesis protein TonB